MTFSTRLISLTALVVGKKRRYLGRVRKPALAEKPPSRMGCVDRALRLRACSTAIAGFTSMRDVQLIA